MAAYELEHCAASRGLQISVFSRGTRIRESDGINPHTLTVLEEAGVPLDNARKHEAKQVTDADVQRAFRIFCATGSHLNSLLEICPEARDKAALLIPDKDIPDPFRGSLD